VSMEAVEAVGSTRALRHRVRSGNRAALPRNFAIDALEGRLDTDVAQDKARAKCSDHGRAYKR